MNKNLVKDYAVPGTRRAARLTAEEVSRRLLPERIRLGQAELRRRRFDITGLKLFFDPRTEFEGRATRTPYGDRLRARRRAASKAAHTARKVNQGKARAARAA